MSRKQAGPTYYKVLGADGRSCHGGNMAWSLPVGTKPGEWHEVTDALKICQRGLHVTTMPVKWWAWNCEVYEVEIAGDARRTQSHTGDKIAVSKCRLLRKLTDAQLCGIGIVRPGEERAVKEGELVVLAGGTISRVSGGTINHVYGGTISRVSGGTISRVSGGTISEVSGTHTTVVFYDGDLPEIVRDHAVVIDRRILTAPVMVLSRHRGAA